MIRACAEGEERDAMPPRAGIHEAERRAQVLRAARACIVALGYERVTMRDIAETAGVSTGTVVHYFRDKESVLEAALLDKIQDTGIAFRAALAGAAGAGAGAGALFGGPEPAAGLTRRAQVPQTSSSPP